MDGWIVLIWVFCCTTCTMQAEEDLPFVQQAHTHCTHCTHCTHTLHTLHTLHAHTAHTACTPALIHCYQSYVHYPPSPLDNKTTQATGATTLCKGIINYKCRIVILRRCGGVVYRAALKLYKSFQVSMTGYCSPARGAGSNPVVANLPFGGLCVYRAGYFANPQGARVQIPSSSHAIDNPFLATSPFCSYNRFASTPL